MVYGLNIVPVHGFYVKVEMLDGNPSAIRSLDQEPDGGVSFRGFTSGRPCHDDHFPTKMRWMGSVDPAIPDFDQAHLLNVSARAKEFIERFEPNIHQFLPVDYLDKLDNLIEKRYFWVVCNRIDSLDHGRTTFILHVRAWVSISHVAKRNPHLLPPGVDANTSSKFVFSLSQIGNAHAWRDKHLDGGGVWLSKVFGDALKRSDLTGLQLSDNGVESR